MLHTFLAALIPLVIGFIWYNPNVFGNAWLKASGTSPERPSGNKMILTFVLTYVMGFFLAFLLHGLVVHQFGLMSLAQPESGAAADTPEMRDHLLQVFDLYQHKFRSFGHGAFHGVILGLFFVLPVVSIIAMFEKKGFKYVAIHVGYWVITLALMAGVVCKYAMIDASMFAVH
jgi:hypothetical protein